MIKKKHHFTNMDKENLFAVLQSFPDQIISAYNLGKDLRFNAFDTVVFSGMGGSAIGGMLLQNFLEKTGFKIPFYVVRDYSIPNFVNHKTLFIACSYSGNTEETINCYEEAKKKRAQILSMSSGGRLKEMSESDKFLFIQLPLGIQPRNAVAYAFFPLLHAFENMGLTKENYDIDKLALKLNNSKLFESAKKLAYKIKGKTPIIYGSPMLSVVAYRWKTQFNENAKTLSYWHEFPELNHNELNAFYNVKGKFHMIILKSNFENKRVLKRIKLTREIISRKVFVTELNVTGKNLLEQVFTSLYIGDLTSFYLAMLYKTDPTPVPVIEEFKKKMGKFY
ncbi:MAG: bifunctional phosphoglucose/phosphomannose isomerase [Candidatus Woesearchaeota archaeon]